MCAIAYKPNPVLSRAIKLYNRHKNPYLLHYGITKEASSLAEADKCSLMLPENDRDVLRIRAATGLDRSLMKNVRVRTGEGIAGVVYKDGLPILIDCEERIRKYLAAPRSRYKTPSSVSLPLGTANEVIGVLNLSDKHSGKPFTEYDVSVLSAFALQIFFILKLSICHRKSEHMRELSTTDFLTGIFNRRYFNIRLNAEHQLLKRRGGQLSLAILDIDNFKLFNDTEGHLAGDRILKKIASIMSHTIRANDAVVRLGGEEFAVIMPQTSKTEAFGIAERIRNNIKMCIQPTWTKFPQPLITASIGIAEYDNCRDPIESLMEKADKAMYTAKVKGKDCTVLYDSGGRSLFQGGCDGKNNS